MSDLTDLFEGKLKPEDFVQKEWNNLLHLIQGLPADLKPAADVVIADAKIVVDAGAQWAGTAVAGYIAANSDKLKQEVVNLVSAVMAGSSPTSVAAQDLIDAVSKLLLALVQHEVLAVVNAQLPAPAAK